MRTNSIDEGQLLPQAAAVFARAEKFRTKTLEPEAFTWEFLDRRANSAALREAARLGLTGIEVDKAVGGLGLGFREKVRIAEILCRSSMSFAFSLINTQNVATRVADRGTDKQRSDYLPGLLSGRRFGATALTEPHAGSDFAAIKTSAAKTADGWVLNGQKAWITNGAIADVILCYVQTDVDKGRDGIACFLIDGLRAGFEAEPAYTLTAGSTAGVSGFSLDNYVASNDELMFEPGQAFRQALSGVNGARIYVAAMACAMVRSGLAEAVEYCGDRESFGKSLLEHQGLRWSLADVANQLEATEALTADAVGLYEAETVGGDVEPGDVAIAASHAKKSAAEMLERSLRACMQAMGAEGLRTGNRVGRLLSESRIVAFVDGTTEMQTDRIGRSLLAHYGDDSLASASVAYRRSSERWDTADDLDEPGGLDEPDMAEHLEQVADDAESSLVESREDDFIGGVPAAATALVSPIPAAPPMPPPPGQTDQPMESPPLVPDTADPLPVGFAEDDPPRSLLEDATITAETEEPADPEPAEGLTTTSPPLPPPSTMLSPSASASEPSGSESSSGPPIPGNEHLLDAPSIDGREDDESVSAAPPLPPESLRQGNS